ncbi:MAG: DegV family protein [Clostridiales bacterium]|nr:DegV family protein [Clostridiales bacterium]
MPEREIRIVTDSTADLPEGYAQENHIAVVPLHVNFPTGGAYRDGVDLIAKDFYPMLLAAGDDIPKTSTPTKEDFIQTYQNVLEESPNCQIISIHISSGLSSTVSVAETAAREISAEIFPFDSKNISFGMGLQVMEAIRLLKEGSGVRKILDHLQLVASHTETMFCLNTLEYLYKGGRIGKVTAIFGSILNIKPMIHVKDGIYEAFGQVRSQRQAIQKMADRGRSLLGERKPLRVGVIHGACETMAEILKAKVEESYQKTVDCYKETGAVIGVHTGPGTLGMTVCHL